MVRRIGGRISKIASTMHLKDSLRNFNVPIMAGHHRKKKLIENKIFYSTLKSETLHNQKPKTC